MSSLNVSTVADYVTIINFVVSIIILIGASISKKLRAWISSILTECLKNTWMKQLIRRISTKIPNLTEFLVMRKGEWSGRTTWYRLLVSYSHWSWVHFFQFLLRGVGCIIAKYILLDIILSFQNIQPFPSCNFDMKYLYSIFT